MDESGIILSFFLSLSSLLFTFLFTSEVVFPSVLLSFSLCLVSSSHCSTSFLCHPFFLYLPSIFLPFPLPSLLPGSPQIFTEHLRCGRHRADRSGVWVPAPELCGFPPPLQALGTLLLAVPCGAGGRGGGESGGGGQSGRESRVLPRHSPGLQCKGTERLLPSLRSPTPFIWSKAL